jgi:hypothetical protein
MQRNILTRSVLCRARYFNWFGEKVDAYRDEVEFDLPLEITPVCVAGTQSKRALHRLLPAGHRKRGDVGVI